ncbi:MAG: SMI1/KNR4 family protein [Alteromonadaceae bacterium]|nr:SMI1/KNR4 family protein [Alteromonadaceae bacterium]
MKKSYLELVQAIKEKDPDWSFSGPHEYEKIWAIEDAYDIKLPESYKAFLMQVGSLEYPNHYYTGIDEDYLDPENGFMANTLLLREEHSLPEGYFCLEYDHDAHELACLDLAQYNEGEYPVVWFNVYSQKIIGQCAKNFDCFIREQLEPWL